jgi:hypothetical protein
LFLGDKIVAVFTKLNVDMPEHVAYYTQKTIPVDITEDEIDEWLAALPDVLDFWETQVAEKRLAYEMQDMEAKQIAAICYNDTESSLSVKNRENIAACDPRLLEATKKAAKFQYEVNLAKAKMAQMEAKLKSVHKIATLRVRRLEQGVTSPTVTSKTLTRNDRGRSERIVWDKPEERKAKVDSVINDEVRKEINQDIYAEDREVW